MDFNEFLKELNNLSKELNNEAEYYKCYYVYLTMLLVIYCLDDSNEISEYINAYFEDIISDSEKEAEIISQIKKKVFESTLELEPSFFESTIDFELYVTILKRINNSSKKRAQEAYRVINNYYNLIFNKVTDTIKYKALKRKKLMSEKEYQDYESVLKNKD